ncbi:hypothetical protein HOO65_060316 [Ceratocystis lukuohia]|uniref:HTH CENPB-type domain-containing protein n=1 Tax=Ceratocystis lukuohia TaxID=2019550 RepID=A0ABR4MDY4_9PEZI
MPATTIEARTLQALQNNPNLSIRRAARTYTIDERRLSDLEERILEHFILDLDLRESPPPPQLRGAKEMANQLLADHDAPPVGPRWASNFRAKCEDPTTIHDLFRLVVNTIVKYGIRSDDIYNFDETGFLMGMMASAIVITVIQAINLEGWSISPFIIGAGQYQLANWYRESNPPGDWAIATTQNGCTDNETGLEWLKHFDRHND